MAATATTKATAVGTATAETSPMETATAMEASAVSAMSSLSAVSSLPAVFRPNSANGDNDGENDRKEHSHVTKVFVAHRSRALTGSPRGARPQFRSFAPENQSVRRSPNSNRLC